MQNRPNLSPVEINSDLMHFVLKTPRRFWLLEGPLGFCLAVGGLAISLIVVFGIQVLGLNNTVYWGIMITNFVFWVGLSQAGIMFTAILRLSRAEWRRPILRAADVLSFFALCAAAVFPIIHTGRMWRTLYWIFPYDFTRGIWPNVRSALVWDPAAIVTYMVGTIASIYLDLIPDMAVARDYSTGWRRAFYNALSLGWYGSERQWKVHTIAGRLLAAFMMPVFILIHSIVSWDLAMTLIPEWHDTLFAPYFIMDAIHSGVAAITTTMVGLFWLLGAKSYIRKEHLDCLGRVLLVTACGWIFFNLVDFMYWLFSRNPLDIAIWELRLFTGPYKSLFITYAVAGFVLPLPVLLIPKLRRTPWILFVVSLLINAALWMERYMLVVPPESYKQPFTFMWTTQYNWRPVEYMVTLAGFALVVFGVVLFAKIFPIISPWNLKQGQIVKRELIIGRVRVPAAARVEHD